MKSYFLLTKIGIKIGSMLGIVCPSDGVDDGARWFV